MITLKTLSPILAALAVGALTAPAGAVPDAHFMKEAAQGGMTEVTLGHMAARKAVDRGVRQFGMQMVRDHSQANRELMRIARQQHVALPHDLGPKNDALRARLAGLHGEAFDRAYVHAMIKDHKEDEVAFNHELRRGGNPPVRTFAGKYLPVVQGHLMMVQDLHRRGL